ncbi:S41 family peptidase [Paenibacillus azoreducens]|uniref:Tail specific protease domain-containing protein n=1 Tax=Paenibacillus azoreducens TaxID=116718 RepID=A0A919YCZ8_9BACL|nr:S41 family peptidase [Paenibacillus azoreducens]GIO48436.1 hypothetical protein J34TS1_32010 [Paenibacillus azoreducens]
MQELSLEQRLLIMSESMRLTEKAFAHWENAIITPDELGVLAEEFFRKAATAEKRADFQIVMWEYFGKLRNAHSNYFDRVASFPHGGMVNFSLLLLGGAWVVKEDDSGLLRTGDEVISVEGKPLKEWLDEIGRLTGITNWRSMIGRLPYYLSHFCSEEQIKIEIMDEQSCRRSFALPRKSIDFEAQNHGETTGRWLLHKKRAYIHIPSFNHPKFEERALGLLEEFRDASSIIIDVRGNGGGSTPGRLTHHLMNRPYRWWKEQARHPEFLRQRHPNSKIRFATDYSYAETEPDFIDPSIQIAYSGKLILLVDRFTGSAAEDFILPFIDNNRATIIGERTFGSTGQTLFRNFDHGNIIVMVGAVRSLLPNGGSFEGFGLVPDIEVSIRREDLYQNRDIALEKALELMEIR